ncbi:TRAM domain-containing protein [Candidatus Woesearchaeota archaeon]|nr:TRAM domain-containing protein [Candidatus Woesearchaeota archaeon]
MYGDRGGYQSRDNVPVNVGDEFEVTIEAVGAKGDGIAKKEGFVLFVPGVQKGDNVRIRITKVLRKVGFAEVVGSSEQPAAEGAPAEESSESEGSSEDSEDFGDEEK